MKNSQQGFSILEMAISLTIIGLLVSAVTVGQNVKHSLELNLIVDDVEAINLATQEFQATHGSLPGDMYNAESVFGTGATDNGNGDGDLGTTDGPGTNKNEKLLFWQHLSLAGLMDGTYDGATNSSASRKTGQMRDSIYDISKSTYNSSLNVTASKANAATAAGGLGLFTTKEAYDYDVNYDDGDPETGTIRGADGSDASAGDCIAGVTPNLTYNVSNTVETPCIVTFYFEQ